MMESPKTEKTTFLNLYIFECGFQTFKMEFVRQLEFRK
jgi:hypothetical protein